MPGRHEHSNSAWASSRRVSVVAAVLGAVALAVAAAVAPLGSDPVVTPPTSSVASSTRAIWVNPAAGSDRRSGATRALALKSLTAAWNKIPQSQNLTRPYRIMVTAGTIPDTRAPNYWELRWGTSAGPISIVSADGPGKAQLPSINMYGVRHFTLDGVAIHSPFDTFHCEKCSYIELKNSAFSGIGDYSRDQGPQEGVKINQSDHIRITDSYLAGATDNALDMVAVQHAYIARNTIAHAVDWCAYAKGGSTDIAFESNDVHHCGTGGITFGQGTGLQFMQNPWTNYEAYGAWAVNNLLHDIDGAALGVNGGFSVLLAQNTAYRIGIRDHLLEVVYGERSCDGTGDDDAACAAIRDAGGWGPRASGGDPVPIGSSQVAVIGNLLYNPDGVQSQYTHFGVYGPRDAGDSGGPDPAVDDDGLIIRGNAIWNGPADLDLGLGGDQGCADDHPTCSTAMVRQENAINTAEPPVHVWAGAAPAPDGAINSGEGDGTIPPFTWTGIAATRQVPAVQMPADVATDRTGAARSGASWQPGAYAGPAPVSTVTTRIAGNGAVRSRTGQRFTGETVVLRGDWLELTASAPAGHMFSAWGGACAGQRGRTCFVQAKAKAKAAAVTVGARFT